MEEYYLWIKSFHIISIIAWMAGMFYLPRIFVYHSDVIVGGPEDKIFQVMERKLLKIIMNPTMVLSIITGLLLAYIYGVKNLGIWFHVKVSFVLILVGFHHFLAKVRKDFARGSNRYSNKFYRIINEIPTIALIVIVIMVIVKPFS